MIRVRVIQHGQPAADVRVDGNTATIGRSPDCDVVLDEPYVSKRHARLMTGLVVADLGSANGTIVDGRRIQQPTLLEDGRFQLGGGDIHLEVEEERGGDAPPASGSGGEPAEQLRRENADLKRRLASAKEDLEALAREGADSVHSRLAGDRVEQLRASNQELQRELDEARARAAREARAAAELREQCEQLSARAEEPGSASELFVQLQSRNRELAARVAELEGGPAAGRVARPAAAPAAALAGGGVAQLLRAVVSEDVDNVPARRGGTAEEFLVLECARFVRQVEKVVTRMAGHFIQLYRLDTMLPDVAGNFRELTGAVLDAPDEPEAREELLRYIQELRKWMVVSFRADREAAARFAGQLRADLSEEKLTEAAPFSAVTKLAGKVEAELWRRASAYLKELSPDTVEDRLEKHARTAVQEMLNAPEADL